MKPLVMLDLFQDLHFLLLIISCVLAALHEKF